MHALSLFLALLFFLSTPSINAEAYKHLKGFSVDVIHRDSPLSPFYNSSMTLSDFIRNAALRSMSRVNRFNLSADKTSELGKTDMIPIGVGYLIKIYIGTPPVETWAIADTGSDVIWVQCSPYVKCYPHKVPLFNPKKSSTYMPESCGSKACTVLAQNYSTCGPSNHCVYGASYLDGSYTEGNLASDSINFDKCGGQSVSFPKSVFGCGRYNVGKFSSDDAGIVGLGRGPLSLVSQLGPEIGRKFSYCLIPLYVNATSKLRFGEEATISRKGVVSTPLMTKPGEPLAYYILNLKEITIGQMTVKTGQSHGNIVIDSGATFTHLESSLYKKVEALVREAVGVEAVRRPREGFKVCYPKKAKGVDFVVHFKGANLSLEQEKLLLPVDNLLCFALRYYRMKDFPSLEMWSRVIFKWSTTLKAEKFPLLWLQHTGS